MVDHFERGRQKRLLENEGSNRFAVTGGGGEVSGASRDRASLYPEVIDKIITELEAGHASWGATLRLRAGVV